MLTGVSGKGAGNGREQVFVFVFLDLSFHELARSDDEATLSAPEASQFCSCDGL